MQPTAILRQRGVSLIEAMMTLAVMAVTVGTVAPGMAEMQDRRRLEGATAQLETELQYARSLAVERRETVRVSFSEQAGESCYVIHTGGNSDCRCGQGGTTVCEDGAQALRTAHFDGASRLQVTSNSDSIGFDAEKGTVTPTATIELRNPRDDRVRLVVNILGRVRACTTTGVAGYRPC